MFNPNDRESSDKSLHNWQKSTNFKNFNVPPSIPETTTATTTTTSSSVNLDHKEINQDFFQLLPNLQPILRFDIDVEQQHLSTNLCENADDSLSADEKKMATDFAAKDDADAINNSQCNSINETSSRKNHENHVIFDEAETVRAEEVQIKTSTKHHRSNTMATSKTTTTAVAVKSVKNVDSTNGLEDVFQQANSSAILINHRKSRSVLIKKQSPSFLIIESLVWNICCAYETDDDRRRRMYDALCRSLEQFSVLGSSYREESLQPLRDKISQKFNEEIYKLRVDFLAGGQSNFLANKTTRLLPSPILDLKFLQQGKHLANSFFEADRYGNEFEEINEISQGGFGIVKKARHRFDNCLYAVKKISFPFKSYQNFVQIIREVKLYANLEPHPNVVAYKTAWIQNWTVEPINNRRHTYTRQRSASKTYKDANFLDDELMHIKSPNEFDDREKSTRYTNGYESTNLDAAPSSTASSSFSSSSSSTSSSSSVRSPFGGDAPTPDRARGCKDSFRNRDLSQKSDDFVTFERSERSRRNERKKFYANNNRKFIQTDSSESDEDEDDDDDDYDDVFEPPAHVKTSDTNMTYSKQIALPDRMMVCGSQQRQPRELMIGSNRRLRAILYIQMELCGINLRQYLDQRNAAIDESRRLTASESAGDSIDVLDLIDVRIEHEHFMQILDGVNFIHSRDMIHRDLKPQNILFSLDGKRVKIGDFGLATIHDQQYHQQLHQDHHLHQQQQQQQHDDRDQFSNELPLQQTRFSPHTSGLGTSIYAAPEQQQCCSVSQSYDHRVDLYSLGIILLEIFSVSFTEMERVRMFAALKERAELPDSLSRRWPRIGDLILRLTNISPAERPDSICDIIELFKRCLDDDNDDHTDIVTIVGDTNIGDPNPVGDLSSTQIRQVLLENEVLKEQIRARDRRISELENIICELKQCAPSF